MNILLELVEFCRQRPHMTTAQLLELWREHEAHTHLHTLATWDLPGADEKQVREFSDAITSLELIWLDAKLGTMPRISDQSGEQRREFVALQKEREQLKAILAGRMGSQRVQK